MTDPTHSDDEIVSSYLDGEATLDEVARVQADPELLAEVQEFEAVAELLSTPVAPLPQSDVDELIGNALDQSATSDRILDLSAIRASRIFAPQRLATIAAGVLLLAGAVGALIALNNSGTDDEMNVSFADSSEAADDSVGDDGDMAFDSDMPADGDDMAEGMPDSADMAEAIPESADTAGEYSEDAGDDMADSEQGVADDQTEATTTVAAVDTRRSYSRLNLEITDSYESLDELIDHTTRQWREIVGAEAPPVPPVIDEQDPAQQDLAEQDLADVRCAQHLHAYIDTLDHSLDSGGISIGISVGETILANTLTTIVVVELSADTAALLATAEPGCAVNQLASLGP